MTDTQYYLDSQPLFEEIEEIPNSQSSPLRKKRAYKKKEIEVAPKKSKVIIREISNI